MLETKDLVKKYKPKKGVAVTALNKVSLTFPEKGMVFLLGKSGSGKSTLLNTLGGLDKYDSGEIIIKGVSSKNFNQQHFDSYRNTYVGFIFQEYNVLDEFTVGANIALAIELQNRKANDEDINNILKEVDLEGFGDRKPNELSGGQKQRVAIARALVKNPEIIMADEPTGALDSNTGRQVFDTLKKLSKTKLIIVVSHDREFAEQYADRIIELSDGNVISDVELSSEAQDTKEILSGLNYHDNIVEVPCGYHLTEEDHRNIDAYIEKLKSGSLEITVSRKNESSKRFKKTDVSKIKKEDGSTFKLIKSKLPLKNAFKIGASGLKYKKVRLVITILLSCIAFGLFGLADTFGAYNHIKTCTKSLEDTNTPYVAVAKAKDVGQGVDTYWRDNGYSMTEKDLKEFKDNTGIEMQGVYAPVNSNLSFDTQIDSDVKLSETDYKIYSTGFTGFAPINQNILDKMNFKLLAGNLPDGSKDEIAISEYTFEVFKKAKYSDGSIVNKEDGSVTRNFTNISEYKDIIGKELTVNNVKYKITGIVDTNFDISRYTDLVTKKEYQTKAEQLVDYLLYNEFAYSAGYSYAQVIMVGDGYIDKMIESRPNITPITEGYVSFYGEKVNVDTQYMARLSDVKNEKITWIDGEKTQLGEKEIIVSSDALNFADKNGNPLSMENSGEPVDYTAILKNATLSMWGYNFTSVSDKEDPGYKIVGIIDSAENQSKIFSTVVCPDTIFEKFTDGTDGVYSYAVGGMPKDKDDIKTMVSYCYREDSDVRFQVQNSVTFELDTVNDVLKSLSKVFLYIGIGFAAFAALMLANFIGTSISHKKQEIGILRAIGSRSNDVFRIFFAESFIIAMINFVLSCIGVFAATIIINGVLRNKLGILITVLNFGPRQVLLLLAVSILVALLASFFPVKRIASKRPIDAIRNR